MHNRAQHFRKVGSAQRGIIGTAVIPQTAQISVDQISFLSEDWLADCQIRQQSERTIELRKLYVGRLQWFLNHRQATICGTSELRSFFAYLTTGHKQEGGRWGYGDKHGASRPMRPVTVRSYYAHLRSFFNWLVGEEVLDFSPLEALAPPQARPDQIQPFTREQVKSLIDATKKSGYPRRDEAILMFLVDTGVRATELCSLKIKDVDLYACRAQVLGKGNKHRTVYFGRDCARILRNYLRHEYRTPDHPIFTTERTEVALTRSGLLQMVHKLGERAGIQITRCSPHTFRHTFAVDFLRAGGNVFALQQLLGHTGLQVTQRYVSLAQADIQSQHRQFSPGDRLK